MRMRLRDHTGAWYHPDSGRWDKLTHLRDSAAKVESDTGVAIIVARTRMPVRIGPLRLRARMFEVAVSDKTDRPGRAGWTRVRTAKSAADIIRGIGLGARATSATATQFIEQERDCDR